MRQITFYGVGRDYAAVDETGAIVGVLKSFNDRFIIPNQTSLKTDSRPFQRHMPNGQPKPIGEYFTKVH